MCLLFLYFLNDFLEVCKSRLLIYLSISSFQNPINSLNEKQTI